MNTSDNFLFAYLLVSMSRLAYDTEALIEATSFNKNDITYFVKVGLLHPTKINNRYIFHRRDVENCLEMIEGMEIKTKEKTSAGNTGRVANN